MSEPQDPRALLSEARKQHQAVLSSTDYCQRCRHDWPCLPARLADTLEAATAWQEQVAALLPCLVDDGECWFDHHGGCQEHAYLDLKPGEKCPQTELKEIVAALGSAL